MRLFDDSMRSNYLLRRGRWIVYIIASIFFATPYLAKAQLTAEQSLVDTARTMRSALGYDVETLAHLEVSWEKYGEIIAGSMSYARTLDPEVKTQLDDCRGVGSRFSEIALSPKKFDSIVSTIQDRSTEVPGTLRDLGNVFRASLTPAQQTSHARLMKNRDLDPATALVSNLSSEQRKALSKAKKKKDRLLLNPRNWHREGVRRRATIAFEKVLTTTLTPEQMIELRVIRSRSQLTRPILLEREKVALREANLQSEATPPQIQNKIAVTSFPRIFQTFISVIKQAIDHYRTSVSPVSEKQLLPISNYQSRSNSGAYYEIKN